jgi:hypothetical protein
VSISAYRKGKRIVSRKIKSCPIYCAANRTGIRFCAGIRNRHRFVSYGKSDAHQIVWGFVRQFVRGFVRVNGPLKRLEKFTNYSRYKVDFPGALDTRVAEGGSNGSRDSSSLRKWFDAVARSERPMFWKL